MTIFQYIEQYKKTNSTGTYADLINNKSMFENSLESYEKQEYERLRNLDKQRLMNEQQLNINKNNINLKQINMSGVSKITQVC